MKILCLFQKFSFSSSTIYLDLVRALSERGHELFIVAGTTEKKDAGHLHTEDGIPTAYVNLPDQFHASPIRKGLIQLTIGRLFLKAVKRWFWSQKLDMIIYPTPPITLAGILKPFKRHFGAVNYLMLKDIFPQNAVDLGMMKQGGALHSYFRHMEKSLYCNSDRIGCMSEGNLLYVKEHYPFIQEKKLELFPNTVAVKPLGALPEAGTGNSARPLTFIVGGNLGKPQAIGFILSCIGELGDDDNIEFIFIGDGTEFSKVQSYISEQKGKHIELHKELPRREYEALLDKCDIGVVSLDSRFTIPNYPSRTLSYMQMAKPMLAITDEITDIRELITEKACCGWWCPSNDSKKVVDKIREIEKNRQLIAEYGRNGRKYLEAHFSVARSVEILENAVIRGSE
ncbi:MAG: glycosyltransferase family 4 protein [Lachnospiraceae bacterium]|nr:glycosyltransferase family 4 protein [Lachnospiraceae bacterium]